MKLKSFVLPFASYAAVALLAVSSAQAGTISGSVYTTAAYPAPLSPSQTPPGTFLGSFSVNQIDFYGPTNSSPTYKVGGFLNSNGSVETGLNPATAAMTMDNKELQFTGSVSLLAGKTYSITHDDGIFLYLNGSSTCTICSGSPTSADTSTFMVGTSGVYTFDLLYAEVNGAPAVLQFPATYATPEPGTFVLLGSGLLGAAGMLRRRLGV